MDNTERLLEVTLEDFYNAKLSDFEVTNTEHLEDDEYSVVFKVKMVIKNIKFTFNVGDIQYTGINGDTTSNSNLTLLLNAFEQDYLNNNAKKELFEMILSQGAWCVKEGNVTDFKKKKSRIFIDVHDKLFPEQKLEGYFFNQIKELIKE